MRIQGSIFVPFILASVILTGSVSAAEKRFITDEFEVTLRSGTSTSNSIVRMLRSGEKVTLLEDDLASKYSLVETSDNKKGYILSRFLVEQPSAREGLNLLRSEFDNLQSKMGEHQDKVNGLNVDLEQERADNLALVNTLRASEQELAKVRNAADNTLNIMERNSQLETIVEKLRKDKTQLNDENLALKDSTEIDWFIRGGAVSLIAFIIGILITRIRWRKHDSWGSY